jgi:uncharacterized protein DUF4229
MSGMTDAVVHEADEPAPAETEQPVRQRSLVRAFAVYSGSRLGLFVFTLGLLLLIGLRGFLVPVIAFLVSGVVSYMVLRRQRIEFGAAVERSVAARRDQVGADLDSPDFDSEDEQG